MRNQETIERLAREEIGDVAFMREVQYGAANLTVWRSARIKPSRKVVILECSDDRLIVPSRDFGEFGNMLKEVQPSLNETTTFFELFAEASPLPRKVLDHGDQVVAKYRDVWKPVTADCSGISFYCENLLQGRFEHITVNIDYTVSVEDIGPGRKYVLR